MYNYISINHCNTLLGRFSLAQKGVMEDADDKESQENNFWKPIKTQKYTILNEDKTFCWAYEETGAKSWRHVAMVK